MNSLKCLDTIELDSIIPEEYFRGQKIIMKYNLEKLKRISILNKEEIDELQTLILHKFNLKDECFQILQCE